MRYVLLLMIAFPAFAQSAHEGHAQYHDVYRTWRIPGTNDSCCNEKRFSYGESTGDCYSTIAEIRAGRWWAKRDNGLWIEIPNGRILNNQANPDTTGTSAHLCETGGYVLCFREPVGGI